ncbi:MAG: mechanosensitive ion channel family protein [Prevotellaceae bacterium]|jgi:MscS family membrane protein|nr:mechanosensitive ion channel family protein [Prevotellaceae bacterium]
MLSQEFYGNTLESWGISLLIIMGVFILNKLFSLTNKYVIQKITRKTKNRFDDIFFTTLEAPVLFGLTLAAIWVALTRLNLGEQAQSLISRTYQILIVLNGTWFVSKLIVGLIEEYWSEKASVKRKKSIDVRLVPMFRRVILIIVWIIGIVTALNNVGLDIKTLLGALGVGGLATALAAQDTIKNIFGGFTLLTDQPFRIGDMITVDSFQGTVEEVGFRSTRIRTLEKRLVTIPNSKIMDASVVNISNEPKRRVTIKLGLTYDTTPEQMKQAISILQELTKTTRSIDPKESIVYFSDFEDSALVITFIYYILKSGDIPQTTSAMNMAILESFNTAGLKFAFPTQSIYMEN